MKKTLTLFLCMAAGLLSCSNDINTSQDDSPAVPMSFDISVTESAGTRASKTAWSDGDKIYVLFNGLATKYLVMTYNSGTWSNASGGGTLESTDFSGLGTKTLTAVHFPVAVDVAYADSKFSFTSGGKPVYNYYLCEVGKAYTVDGTTVTATLSMGKPAGMVQIHVAGIQANVSDYTFGCTKIKPVACKSVGTDGTITEDVLQAGARLSGVADSDGGIYAGRLINPGEAADYVFTVASNDNYNTYTLTRTGKALSAGKMYNFPALDVTGDGNWAVSKGFKATAADLSTVVAAFNASAEVNPVLYLADDISVSITITRDDGIIDLDGHNISQSMFIQNNVEGKEITIRNGTISAGIDGKAGQGDYYAGTLILENLTVTGTIWNDGHAYFINGGTYNQIELKKNASTPGTITINDGYFGGIYRYIDNYGGSDDGSKFILKGGKYKNKNTTNKLDDWCASGYSVKANTDDDKATYPYIVSATE